MLALLNDLGVLRAKECLSHPMKLYDGHVLVDSAGMTLLIDTGAPFSVGASEFPFGGSPRLSFGGVTVEGLSKEVGASIDALVGMDFIADFDLRFDAPNSLIEITRNEMEISNNAPHCKHLISLDFLSPSPKPNSPTHGLGNRH